VGVTGRQGMLTPPRHLIPPLVYPEVSVCHILRFVFSTGLTKLMTVRYSCYFIVHVQILIRKSTPVQRKKKELQTFWASRRISITEKFLIFFFQKNLNFVKDPICKPHINCTPLIRDTLGEKFSFLMCPMPNCCTSVHRLIRGLHYL
jgi:hypothetical protein